MEKEKPGIKILSDNRKARFHYHIQETFEAGLVVSGAEIKSIRAGGVSLAESYVRPERGELFIVGMHVRPYGMDARQDYDPLRKRKLLMHRREIRLLQMGVEKKGLTIIPLKIYLKRGYAKLEIALARGKGAPDKRQTILRREAGREAARAMKKGQRSTSR